MSKKLRLLLIFSLIGSFFILAPILIFYSQGYRFYFDPTTNQIKIVQIGGLSLKIEPNGANVFLDNQFKERTGFLSSSIYLDNLKPKKYNIRVEKEGFYDWQKNLEIKEKEVTEAKNILLIPKDLEIKSLTSQIEDFWIFSDKELILKENDGEEWFLKMFDLGKNLKSHLISQKEISLKEPQLLDLKFSADFKKIILKIGLKEKISFFILDLNQSPIKLVSLNSLEETAEEAEFNPANADELIYFKDGELFKLTADNSQKILTEILDYQILEEKIYYLDKKGYLFTNNLSFGSEKRINDSPLLIKTETNYQIKAEQDHIFILEDKIVYFFNPEKKLFEKLYEPVKEIKISPDSQKALFFNEHEIWLLFLKEQKEQPKKEAMSQQFLIRLSEKINDVFWLNSYYLIFNYSQGKIKVIEIDDRDKTNNYELSLSEILSEKLIWYFANKNLYLLSNKQLFLSEKFKHLR